ncbi:UDP-N-acetylmuramyl-tripeptide synthetase [bacterium]|nr:UDP-N-acetylmuramyl-tripeptide synthetase [bacterium]
MDRILNTIKNIIPVKLFKKIQPIYHFVLNYLASLLYGRPSEKMIIIGITGTTGKTTSVYMIARVLKQAGYKVGYTSTAMFSDGNKEWLNDKKMTMVGRFFTQRLLSEMSKNGCHYAIVETTSEGISQFRHRFINYDILVFTGLYPEHIESHGSFEKYKEAKGELFAHLKRCKIKYADDQVKIQRGAKDIGKIDLNRVKKTIIVNGEDDNSSYFLDFWAERKIGYYESGNKKDDNREQFEKIYFSDIESDSKGVVFAFNNNEVKLNILGEFNVQNSMNAVSVAIAQKIEDKNIIKGLEGIKGIAGKLEKIDVGQDFIVIIDYAFEPNALEKLYQVVEKLDYNKVIHVLGSTGGGRDVSRRGELGKIAGEKADKVIVTNEDPYDEDPEIIIAQVASGAEYRGKKEGNNLYKILDRREAISRALHLAEKNDIVLITGKGCEQAICEAKGRKTRWDDREVAREEIDKLLN